MFKKGRKEENNEAPKKKDIQEFMAEKGYGSYEDLDPKSQLDIDAKMHKYVYEGGIPGSVIANFQNVMSYMLEMQPEALHTLKSCDKGLVETMDWIYDSVNTMAKDLGIYDQIKGRTAKYSIDPSTGKHERIE
jgi:hypothetical protein